MDLFVILPASMGLLDRTHNGRLVDAPLRTEPGLVPKSANCRANLAAGHTQRQSGAVVPAIGSH